MLLFKGGRLKGRGCGWKLLCICCCAPWKWRIYWIWFPDVLRQASPLGTVSRDCYYWKGRCIRCVRVDRCSRVWGHCSSVQREQIIKWIRFNSTQIWWGGGRGESGGGLVLVTDVHAVAGRTALHHQHVLSDSDGQQAVYLIIHYILIFSSLSLCLFLHWRQNPIPRQGYDYKSLH